MISRVSSLRAQAKAWSRILTASRTNFFSTAIKDQQFEDIAAKFEREWKLVYDETNTNQAAELSQVLTPNKKKRAELLAEAIVEMDLFELRYFSTLVRDRVAKTSGINPLKLNVDWPSLKQADAANWSTNYFQQQEAINKLWPSGQLGFAQNFGGGAFAGGVGGAVAPQQQQAEAPKVEEKVEEKPQEKSKFDIELAGIDATKKIAIIKEVRELLKLGLKEAKEMVEKAPVVLQRDVKKEEAEQLKEKLAALGCSVNLL